MSTELSDEQSSKVKGATSQGKARTSLTDMTIRKVVDVANPPPAG
jgi:hypothetical protein